MDTPIELIGLWVASAESYGELFVAVRLSHFL